VPVAEVQGKFRRASQAAISRLRAKARAAWARTARLEGKDA